MKKRVVHGRGSKNTLTPLNKKLLMVLVVIVLAGVVIAVLNQGGLTGSVINFRPALVKVGNIKVDGIYLYCLKNSPKLEDAKSLLINLPGNEVNDLDRDGISTACDNCPTIKNRDQRDLDGDNLGSTCDAVPIGFKNSDGDSIADVAVKCGKQQFGADPHPGSAMDWVRITSGCGEKRAPVPAGGAGGGGAVTQPTQPSPRSSP